MARAFTSYHKSILEWLNEADTIDVYAVTVRAFRVGEALAADFDTVVEPGPDRNGPSLRARKSSSTRYAEFYRPLVTQLRQSKVLPLGRGGWRGRWRSFQTGHADAVYATSLADGKARVYLYLFGTGYQQRYRALLCHQEEIDRKVDGAIVWREESEGARVMLEKSEAVSLTASEDELETVRRWMVVNLLQLRDALQPHLASLMRAKNAAPDEVGGAG